MPSGDPTVIVGHHRARVKAIAVTVHLLPMPSGDIIIIATQVTAHLHPQAHLPHQAHQVKAGNITDTLVTTFMARNRIFF